ncbi:hypothetical protein [Aliagarivorans taiwanensis]|nr:hypothetical protein [Aliagarivorans taiwanensis]
MANTIKHYHPLSRILHWLVAVVVVGMFALGYWMVGLNYYSEWYRTDPHH